MPHIQTTREVLPNGLTVLVTEDHTSPVAAITLWVSAGYFDEEDREVGISHVIEHMFFKGTADRPRPDQIAVEIKALGGELNAGTYYEATNYYVVLPSQNFRRGLEIQADALMHPLIDPEELTREKEAVLQEARRKLDSPGAFAVETMYGEAFHAHRIRRWRIGTEEGIRALTRDDLLGYYRSHYVPGRIVLSIAGDVRAAEAIEAAHLFLGGMPAAEGAPLGSPPEPPATRFRYRRLTGDIKRAVTVLGFRAAPALSDDDYALRVLAHLLGSGRSSRLFQAVKERDGLVDGISASVESFRDLGVMLVMSESDAKKTRPAARGMQAEISAMRQQPVGAAEIERARAAIEFRYHQSRAEVLGRSLILAYYESMGGHALAEEVVERLRGVTPADVRRVAEEYLDIARATLLEYVPESGAEEAPDEAALLDDLQRLPPGSPLPESPAPRPAPSAGPGQPAPARVSPAGTVGSVERHRFESGPLLVHEQRRDLPLVTLSAAFRGGRSGESRENSGITRLMQATLLKGTASRNARQVATDVDALGTEIDRLLDEDYFGFSMTLLSRHARRGFEILMDLVRRPAFRLEELEKERALQLAAQDSIRDQSLAYTFQLFRHAAFGSHPYSLPSLGLQASVQAARREDLLRWHRLTVRPAAMVVTAVGDIGRDEIVELVARGIDSWAQEGHGGSDPGQILAWGPAEVVESRRRHQTAQVIGFPTPGLASPERLALDLVQAITSGLGGRFFEEIRGRRGLAYAVHAFNYNRIGGGAFAVYLATSPKDEILARRVLFEEIGRLRRDGPRREEVERAARYALGGHAISMQTNTARGLRYLDAELRGLGIEEVLAYPERITGVGYESVHDAVWRYLDPDHCAIGVLRGDGVVPGDIPA